MANKTVELTLWQARKLKVILTDYTARLDEDAQYCADPEEAKSCKRRGALALRLWRGVDDAEKRVETLCAEQRKTRRHAAWLKPGAVCHTLYLGWGVLTHFHNGGEYAGLKCGNGDKLTILVSQLYPTARAAKKARESTPAK